MATLPALPQVRSSVTQGLSANAGYRDYQQTAHDNGLRGMRRQDYLRLYSATRAVRAQTLEAMGAPKDEVAGGMAIPVRPTIQATGYGHWVGIHQRTRGQSDYIFTPFLVKSREPMTPAEAEARAMEFLDTSPDEYNRVLRGISYMGAERFEPMQR